MEKWSSDINDYKCVIDERRQPYFTYKNKPIQGSKFPYDIRNHLQCSEQSTIKTSVYIPVYFSLLPSELKKILLYYLSRFDLLYILKNDTILGKYSSDDQFWKTKFFIDFDSRLREDINEATTKEKRQRAEREYEMDLEDINGQGNNIGWKNLYLIFTYAEEFGEVINRDTINELRSDMDFLAIPELMDAYLKSNNRGDFLIDNVSNPKTISYILKYYPQYRKYVVLNLLLTDTSKLIKLIETNPELNISLLELASLAQNIKLDRLTLKSRFYDDIRYELVDIANKE